MEINIAHLYPDLLNLYGDRGNIITLKRRCELRGITANIHEYELADGIDFANTDIIFIGGGSDREQKLVCDRLCEFKDEIKSYANDGGSLLAVCGGYFTDALAGLSFTSTRPASQASLATVRRLISLETFKNLSNLISLFSCILLYLQCL